MNANIHCCTIDFLSLDSLNVNYKLLTVHLDHLADLLALVVASNNLKTTTAITYEVLFL